MMPVPIIQTSIVILLSSQQAVIRERAKYNNKTHILHVSMLAFDLPLSPLCADQVEISPTGTIRTIFTHRPP
jgi:hypothetical protein